MYKNYVSEYTKQEINSRYNYKYRNKMREADKRILETLQRLTNDPDKKYSLLDLGCGNGNFLYHLKQDPPTSNWELFGVDLAQLIIDENLNDPDLKGIKFATMDIATGIQESEKDRFDFVILIAVLQVLTPELIKRTMANIYSYLKPGGYLVNFDGYHSYEEHDIVHVELDIAAPNNQSPKMDYYYPSKRKAQEWLESIGFQDVNFSDFNMPFDLPRPSGNPWATHTELLHDGRRNSRLGIVCQPWSICVAKKA